MLGDLPEELLIDILSRLPIRSIISCRRVCRRWRQLIDGSDFVPLQLSRASASWNTCVALRKDSKSSKAPYRIYTFDSAGSGAPAKLLSRFGFGLPPKNLTLYGSVDGLILLSDENCIAKNLFVCNPVTREYAEIPPPPSAGRDVVLLGFGASRVSRQYKVVVYSYRDGSIQVYSAGVWRNIPNPNKGFLMPSYSEYGLFNGNLHWIADDELDFDDDDDGGSNYDDDSDFDDDYGDSDDFVEKPPVIGCFDLETEVFTTFSTPPGYEAEHGTLCALNDRLCLCYSLNDEIVFWYMNIYGDIDSWTKEIVVKIPSDCGIRGHDEYVFPIRVFKDSGDILLMKGSYAKPFIINETKSIHEVDGLNVPRRSYLDRVVVYTPTFLSLKAMGFSDSDLHDFDDGNRKGRNNRRRISTEERPTKIRRPMWNFRYLSL